MVVNKSINKTGSLTVLFLVTVLILLSQTMTQAFSQEIKTISSTEALIRAAADGGSYQLAAGRYELEDTLLIERDFSLFGADMDSTEIITKAEFLGVSVQGDISVSFEDITFKHEGDLQEDVVAIKDAQFLIDSCKFTGGIWQEVAEDAEFVYGAGLWLHGTATGEIRDSIFSDNDANGINISGEVELRLEQSSISNNGWAGMLVLGESKVFATQLFSTENQEEGMALDSNSYLMLADSVIEANQGGGVWLYGDSSTDITDTLFRENKTYAGLGLTGNASAQAHGNSFYNHEVASIYVYGKATSNITENTIAGNDTGIAVADEAQVQIRKNVIFDNLAAINTFDTASVMIIENEFNGVIEDGINLNDQSYASIRANEFIGEGISKEGLGEDDIYTLSLISSYDSASSYITSNTFDYTDVNVAHVYMGGTSQNTIVDNLFVNNNANPAIDVNIEAIATIRDNVISTNSYGIIVRGSAFVSASSNIFEDNGYSILAYAKGKLMAANNIMDYGVNSAVALREESQVWLRDTSIQHAGDAAVDIRGSSRAGLFNNEFSYNESFGVYSIDKSVTYANKNYIGANYNSGVYTAGNSNVSIIDNVVEDHYEYGVEIAGETGASTAYNYFSNNNVGLGFGQDASLKIIENNFVENNTDVSRIK